MIAVFLALLAPLSAQVATATPSVATPAATPELQAMQAGLTLHSDAAAGVISGSEKSAPVIARLKAQGSPSGLKIDKEADFAFAAIDVGQRLIAAGKPAEAEEFFLEAEKSLDKAVKKTADAQTHDKAMFLEKLSMIRGLYLNKADQATADIDQAIALQPEDGNLKKSKDRLERDRGDRFKDKLKG